MKICRLKFFNCHDDTNCRTNCNNCSWYETEEEVMEVKRKRDRYIEQMKKRGYYRRGGVSYA